jgi:hypothetical protein
MKNYPFLLLLALFLAACGPSKENSTNSKEFETRQALLDQYSPLVGVYRGEVVPASARDDAYPVELKLSIVDEKGGVNENGEVIYRPALIGTYQRKDIDPDSVPLIRRPLNIRFYKETNELSMQNSDAITGQNPQVYVVYISARYSGNRIVGQISNGYGLIGNIDVSRLNR